MQYLITVFEKFAEFKLITIAILGVLVVGCTAIVLLKRQQKIHKDNTRMIVYGGLCIALSFVLSYIRLYHWPQGGSVTPASMLPMFFFAAAFGPIAGITAGIAYGFLQLIQDPYVVHWAQLFLDYPLAFGAMGLAGVYGKNLAIGSLIGGFGRFLMHFISGVIFFGSYAPEGMNVLWYSLTVNGLIIGADLLICIIVSLLPAFNVTINRIRRTSMI